MMLRKFCYLAVLVVLVFGIQSCNENDPSTGDNTSRIQLKLVDAPGDYLEVNVKIIDIQYNNSEDDEGWKSFELPNGDPIEVDLTELIADNSLLLTDEIIPSGMLKQIRLVLADEGNTLVVDEGTEEVVPGEPIDLKTPSAQQSGLKLKLDAVLEPGFSYTFILDWDVQKSIVKAGNSGNYILKPVINVIAEVNSGSLMGNVVGKLNAGDDDPVAIENVVVDVYSSEDMSAPFTSTSTDASGNFLVQGLAGGTYIIKIDQEGYQDYETSTVDPDDTITIEVGVVTDAGTIELLLADSIKGNVVGKLLPADASPIAIKDVMVDLYLKDDLDTSIGSATTDDVGNFAFSGLATGSYILKIKHDGYQDYQTSIDAPIEVEFGVLNELASIEILLVE